MDRTVRKHLERAQRVADFARQYPSDLPGYQAALDRIEERLARAAEAAQEEVEHRRVEEAAIAERLELRKQITAELQFVAGIARTAGVESVGTPIVLRYPGPQRNQLQFLAGARQVVAKASAEEELLRRFGLAADQLPKLTAELDEFARLLSLRESASRTHIGARTQLKGLGADLRVVVEQMHAINRFRYRKDAPMLAMWMAARDLRIGPRKPGQSEVEDAEPLALPPGSETRSVA